MTKCILVGYDDEKHIMVVGHKHRPQGTDIINVLSGDETDEIWRKLTVKKAGDADE